MEKILEELKRLWADLTNRVANLERSAKPTSLLGTPLIEIDPIGKVEAENIPVNELPFVLQKRPKGALGYFVSIFKSRIEVFHSVFIRSGGLHVHIDAVRYEPDPVQFKRVGNAFYGRTLTVLKAGEDERVAIIEFVANDKTPDLFHPPLHESGTDKVIYLSVHLVSENGELVDERVEGHFDVLQKMREWYVP